MEYLLHYIYKIDFKEDSLGQTMMMKLMKEDAVQFLESILELIDIPEADEPFIHSENYTNLLIRI